MPASQFSLGKIVKYFKIIAMNIILPFIFFLIPLAFAFKLSGWKVTVAFLVAVIAVPFCVIFISEIFQKLVDGKPIDWKGCFAFGFMFAMGGFPIFFLIILPLYHFLKSIPFNFYITFPTSVALVMLAVFFMIAERRETLWVYPIIIGCGAAHALLIIWLINKFNAVGS
jgi:hypothetical protein